tara:strand:+ start:385 stop:582 length:198 start_codon:yes stop_codon:yes gene_type:complete
LGAKAPFFLYKNMDKTRALLDLCYKRGTLIGLKQAMLEVKTHELNILKEITKIEEEIKELEKEDE